MTTGEDRFLEDCDASLARVRTVAAATDGLGDWLQEGADAHERDEERQLADRATEHGCITCGTPLVYPQRSCSRECALASYGRRDRGPATVAPANTAGPRFVRCETCGARCAPPTLGPRACCARCF